MTECVKFYCHVLTYHWIVIFSWISSRMVAFIYEWPVRFLSACNDFVLASTTVWHRSMFLCHRKIVARMSLSICWRQAKSVIWDRCLTILNFFSGRFYWAHMKSVCAKASVSANLSFNCSFNLVSFILHCRKCCSCCNGSH